MTEDGGAACEEGGGVAVPLLLPGHWQRWVSFIEGDIAKGHNVDHDSLLQIVSIYNGRRKVNRLAEEVKDLAKHGVMIKPELQGETKATAKRLF